MSALFSKIELLLQGMLERPGGLQYIVFLPGDGYDASMLGRRPRAANSKSIDILIRLHGLDRLGHTWEQQVTIWETKIAPVANFFDELDKAGPLEADGTRPSLARVVLDVEVGGLFYATVGSYGWVFAATLDQQPLNTGLAERHLIATVKELESLLTEADSL
jgi:hypothetical protein